MKMPDARARAGIWQVCCNEQVSLCGGSQGTVRERGEMMKNEDN
jgi:hypothetical protein